MSAKGFTLVELSMVILIIGILLGGGFSLSLNQIDKYKADVTNARLDAIEEALTQFLSNNGRLPCPADNVIPSSNSLYGFEQIPSSGAGPQLCSATNLLRRSYGVSEVIYGGAVPFKTLGLSNDFMLDGWGNKILYTTTKSFTNNHLLNTSCVPASQAASNNSSSAYNCFRGQIGSNVINVSRYIASPAVYATTSAAYVLISAGLDGYGAYSNSMSANAPQNAASTSTNEIENFNGDFTFVLTGYQNASSAYSLNQFTNIVRYKTRNNLVSDCNRQYNLSCINAWGIDWR